MILASNIECGGGVIIHPFLYLHSLSLEGLMLFSGVKERLEIFTEVLPMSWFLAHPALYLTSLLE